MFLVGRSCENETPINKQTVCQNMKSPTREPYFIKKSAIFLHNPAIKTTFAVHFCQNDNEYDKNNVEAFSVCRPDGACSRRLS